MHCKAVCVAIYDYAPQADEELKLTEGDILLVTENEEDPDWWTATIKSADTFADASSGLVPASYLQEAEPTAHVVALYEYAATSPDELTFPEDARLNVYDTSDPEWWFAKYGDSVGLIPATYVEPAPGSGQGGGSNDAHAHAPPPLPEPIHEPVPDAPEHHSGPSQEEAESQKKQLLSALGGFGFEKPKSAAPKVSKENLGPEGINYYSVTQVDKKKKKSSRKGFLGVSDEYAVILVSDLKSKEILAKWDMAEISKFSEKKNKKLILEVGGEEQQFEAEKHDVLALLARLQSLDDKVRNRGSSSKVPFQTDFHHAAEVTKAWYE
ncbi:cytoskeletal protein binding protein [Thoreauomyces humboldtii]|nr:cytoskeletal protein binding protein [Thoreauomyces humboldtii]